MLKSFNNFNRIKHITKNSVKNVNLKGNKFIERYLESAKCNVNVWSSSIIELQLKFDRIKYLRNKIKFTRKYKKIELIENGVKFVPNFLELSCLRPQLTACDLLINSSKDSNKVFLYLLPHLLINYYINNYVNKNFVNKLVKFNSNKFENENQNKIIKDETLNKIRELNEGKLIVLLPTIDLTINDSRIAHNCLKKDKKVSFLLYRDIVLDNLENVLDSDVIYSTPKSFLKLLTKFPFLIEKIRNVIVDESERMICGQFGYLLVRIRSLLLNNVQFVFLSNFTDNYLLNQFISRFSKLNFKIISFPNNNCNNTTIRHNSLETNKLVDNDSGLENKVGLIKHVYGPIRDIEKHKSLYNILNTTTKNDIRNESPLELKVKQNRDLIIENQLNQNKKERSYSINYLLYEPNNFVNVLLNELNKDKKTIVYFPTVKMCQFCYIYFKHYLQLFHFNNSSNPVINNNQLLHNNFNNSNSYNYNNQLINNNFNTYKNDEEEDEFMFYDFHSGLSLSKRRFVLDSFKTVNRGLLFCTNLAININFHNVSKIINVSFTFNIPELLNKFFYNYSLVPNRELNSNCTASTPDKVEKVMLLNNLDGHILYEYYKNNINLILQNNNNNCNNFINNNNSINNKNINNDLNNDNVDNERLWDSEENSTNTTNNSVSNNLFNKNDKDSDNLTNNNYISDNFNKVNCDIYLKSSCELMYRSLLGYYSENAKRLKIEKWTIPSFLNEFVKSFGINDTFKVSKQFAVRSQLIDSPGLEICSNFNKKSALLASIKSSPYFTSKYL